MNTECFILFYNHEKFVKDRLENLFEIFPIEYITIIDDFSTDNTIFEIEEFLSKKNIEIKLIKNHSNKGILNNWKYCCQLCTKDFIWILEGDDLTDINFFKRYLNVFKKNSNLDLFSGITYTIDDKNKVTGKQTKKIFQKLKIDFLLDNKLVKFSELNIILSILNIFPNLGSLIFKKNVLKSNLDLLDQELIKIEYAYDWILYYLLSKDKKLNFYFDFNAINFFRIHENNHSEQKDNSKKIKEINRVYKLMDTLNKYKQSKTIEQLRNNYLKTLNT